MPLVGRRIPGGLPPRVDEVERTLSYVVGTKPLKYGPKTLQPGEPVPPELIARIPRLESWVRWRRIKVAT